MRAKEIQELLNAAHAEIKSLGNERALCVGSAKVIARVGEVTFCGEERAISISVDDLQKLVDFIARMYGMVGRVDQ